jgi:hypothetical protein
VRTHGEVVRSPNSKIGAAKRCAGALINGMALEEVLLALAKDAGWRFGLLPSRRLRLFDAPTTSPRVRTHPTQVP